MLRSKDVRPATKTSKANVTGLVVSPCLTPHAVPIQKASEMSGVWDGFGGSKTAQRLKKDSTSRGRSGPPRRIRARGLVGSGPDPCVSVSSPGRILRVVCNKGRALGGGCNQSTY